MKRARVFGCLLGLSALVMPAKMAIAGDDDEVGTTPFHGVWTVLVTPDQAAASAGRQTFKDHMLFEADGLMTAEAFGPMGFGRAEYTVTDLGGGVYAFTTTMSNAQQGTLVYNGVRRDGAIIGSLVWTKADGAVATYSFRAEPMSDD